MIMYINFFNLKCPFLLSKLIQIITISEPNGKQKKISSVLNACFYPVLSCLFLIPQRTELISEIASKRALILALTN